jgi:hypothetical protein
MHWHNPSSQNIENMWMRVKPKIRRQFGTSRALFQTYLSEFRWRNFHRNDDKFKHHEWQLHVCRSNLYIWLICTYAAQPSLIICEPERMLSRSQEIALKYLRNKLRRPLLRTYFGNPIYIYIYVWKLNQTVLELDFRAVNFLFFPRRGLNPHH